MALKHDRSMQWLAALVMLSGPASALAQPACLDDSTSDLTLTGLVFLRSHYGPPNYGEHPDTDTIETQAFLALDEPICVAGEDESSQDESSQDVITLVPAGKLRFRPYAERRVRLHGVWYRAETGHHRTPVLIRVVEEPEILR